VISPSDLDYMQTKNPLLLEGIDGDAV